MNTLVEFLREWSRHKIATGGTVSLAEAYAEADAIEHLFPQYRDREARNGSIRTDIFNRACRDGELRRVGRATYISNHDHNGEATMAKTAAMKRERVVPFPRQKAPVNIQWVRPDQIVWDATLLVNSRNPAERIAHLQTIADNWDWNKFDLPKVAPRPNNTFAPLDGAGTAHALQHLRTDLSEKYLIPVHVVDDTVNSPVKEAGIFLGNKARKALKSPHFFIGELIAGEPEATGIRDEMAELNIEIPNEHVGIRVAKWPDGFDAIPVMRVLYRHNLLTRVLVIARSEWPNEKGNIRHFLIALGAILQSFPRIDEKQLRKVLRAHPPTTVREGTDFKKFTMKLHHYEIADPIAQLYLDLYDKSGLPDNKKIAGNGTGSHYKRDSMKRQALHEASKVLIGEWKMVSGKIKQT